MSPNARQQEPWENVEEGECGDAHMLIKNEALGERNTHLYSVSHLALQFLLLLLISISVFAFVFPPLCLCPPHILSIPSV